MECPQNRHAVDCWRLIAPALPGNDPFAIRVVGSVRLNDAILRDNTRIITSDELHAGAVLSVGRNRFARVILSGAESDRSDRPG